MEWNDDRAESARAFLECVLPAEGYYIAVIFNTAHPKPGIDFPRQVVCETIDELTQVILAADDQGRTVYHACASFKDPNAKKPRSHANAARVRSLWIDIDAGPGKPYRDAEDAYIALAEFYQGVGLPTPIVASSGSGIHCYWPFEQSLYPEEWHGLSSGLKALSAQHGLHIDPSRTADISSILRTPGTHNRKNGERLVESSGLRRYDLLDFQGLLQPDRSEPRSVRTPTTRVISTSILGRSETDSPSAYPASYADTIADNCAQLARFRTSGNLPEPERFACIGVLAFCENGQIKSHEWGAHDFPNYTYEKTQYKFDRKRALTGATTCAQFESLNPDGCKGCQHRGKITSPISLGYAQPILRISSAAKSVTPNDFELPILSEPFSWSSTGQLLIQNENLKGDPTYFKISENPAFLKGVQIGEIDGESHSYTFLKYLPHEGWKTTVLNAKEFHGQATTSMLADKGIIVHDAKMFLQFARWQIDEWHKAKKMETRFDQYGWKMDDSAFLFGDRCYGPMGVEPVAVAKIAQGRTQYLQPKKNGSLQGWSDAIDSLFAKGFEAQAFMTLCAPAAVFMKFQDRTEGGVIVHAYTVATARGKTMGLRGAWTFWGDELGLRLTQEATPISKSIMMGVLSNLPVIHDELGHKDPEVIRRFVSIFRDGRDRMRGTVDGTIREIAASWNTILLSADNESLIETLADSGPDAPTWRVFEVDASVPGKIDAQHGMKVRKALEANAGHAGDVYLRWLTQPAALAWARTTLEQQTRDIWAKTRLDERYRCRVNLLGAVATAGIIVKELGIIDFQPSRIMEWAIDQMTKDAPMSHTARQEPVEHAEQVLGEFLNLHWGETIVVADAWRPKQAPRPPIVKPHNKLSVRFEIATKRLYVAETVFREWARSKRLSPRDVVLSLEKIKLLSQGRRRVTLSAGTDIPGLQIWCLEVNALHPACSGLLENVENLVSVDGRR